MELAEPPSELYGAACDGWTLPFQGQVYDYGATLNLQNGYAIKGNFDVQRSKYLIAPFESLKDRRIRQIILLKAVQTGGSLVSEIWALYSVMHDPGDLLWLFQDDDFQAKFTQERLMPLLRNDPELREKLDDADRVKIDTILFKHMAMVMGGLNEGNCQGLSRQRVIIDEAWLAGNNGLIRQAKARTTAYPHTKKILIVSQAGIEGDDLDLEWKQSDMREWNWQCPSCEKHQSFTMSAKREDGTYGGMKFDSNETTKPNGRWNYPAVAKTARLECLHCGHQVEDTPANRRRIDDTHRYVATNPGADETIAGFNWPAIANVDISFASVVTQYLQAKVQHDEQGYDLPLTEFYQKVLAKPWSLRGIDDSITIEAGSYDVNADWPDEAYRFLIADCQKELKKFFVGVFAVSLAGEIRELARETALSFDDVEAIQKLWKVRHNRTFLDCGYRMGQVLRECVQRGREAWQTINGRKIKMWVSWIGLKGSGLEVFQHTNPRTKQQENKIHSPIKHYDVNEGTNLSLRRALYYEWSNLHCKDILDARLRGTDGLPKVLTLPDPLPPEDEWSFTAQMRSERAESEFKNGRKRRIWKKIKESLPNHEWDKFAMLFAVLAIFGIIGPGISGTTKEEQQEAA